jgi:hypothetical protein
MFFYFIDCGRHFYLEQLLAAAVLFSLKNANSSLHTSSGDSSAWKKVPTRQCLRPQMLSAYGQKPRLLCFDRD